MGIWHPSPTYATLQSLAGLGWCIVIGLVIGIALLALRHRRRGGLDLASFAPEGYLVAVIGATLVIDARSAVAAAYYMLIPYWGMLTLGALLLRRIARWGRVGRFAALAVALAVVASLGTAYASLFTERSAWRVLTDASGRMEEVGALVRSVLDDRPVESVAWRTLGDPNGHQYLIRGIGSPLVDDEIWPWLIGDAAARPPVTALEDGDAEEWRTRAGEHAGPGEVLLVLSEDYRLALLVYEGAILYLAPETGAA
jgi:hypothetical protein